MNKDVFVTSANLLKQLYFSLTGMTPGSYTFAQSNQHISFGSSGQVDVRTADITLRELLNQSIGNIKSGNIKQENCWESFEEAFAEVSKSDEDYYKSLHQHEELIRGYAENYRVVLKGLMDAIEEGRITILRRKEILMSAVGKSIDDQLKAIDLAGQEMKQFDLACKKVAVSLEAYLKNPLASVSYALPAESLSHAVAEMEKLVKFYKGAEEEHNKLHEQSSKAKLALLNKRVHPETHKPLSPGEERDLRKQYGNGKPKALAEKAYNLIRGFIQYLQGIPPESKTIRLDRNDVKVENKDLLEAIAAYYLLSLDLPSKGELREPATTKPGPEPKTPKALNSPVNPPENRPETKAASPGIKQLPSEILKGIN